MMSTDTFARRQESVGSLHALQVQDHRHAEKSYELMGVVAALLAGIGVSISFEHPDSTCGSVVNVMVQVIAGMNLFAVCILGIVAFYILQLKEKNKDAIGEFRIRTKRQRLAAQLMTSFSIPLLILTLSANNFCTGNYLSSLAQLSISIFTAYSLYHVRRSFHYLRHLTVSKEK